MKKIRHRSIAATVVAISLMIAVPVASRAVEFDAYSPSQSALELVDGEIHSELNAAGCAADHEMACTSVLQRSEFVSKQSHGHGDEVDYRWDIMVPKTFKYGASRGYLRAVRLINRSGESILSFILDGESGYSVGRKVCFGPEAFGIWHSVELKVVWDSTKRKSLKEKTAGALKVFCDGTEVLRRAGRPNIAKDDEVWLSIGLAGSLKLASGDSVATRYRNVEIEDH